MKLFGSSGIRRPVDAGFMLFCLKVGMAVGWAVVTAVGYAAGGVTGAVIAGGITALILGVVYISM